MSNKGLKDQFHMQTLNFNLHPFLRVTWVSRQAEAVWSPRIRMINEALAALKYSIVASGIYPIALVQEYPHRVDRLRSTLASLRLKVFHLEASAKALSRFYLVPLPSAEKRIFVVIGSEERFQNVLAALKKNRFSEFHAQLGIPQCCIDFLERLKQSSTREVVWPVALNSMSEQGAESRTAGAHCPSVRRQSNPGRRLNVVISPITSCGRCWLERSTQPPGALCSRGF